MVVVVVGTCMTVFVGQEIITFSAPQRPAGRFQRPSERVPFSDEGGFVFSKAPFKGTLHEGLKGASPSEGFKRA